MQCEICGKEIRGEPATVKVEGSEFNVCRECEKYGVSVKDLQKLNGLQKNSTIKKGQKIRVKKK